MGRTWTRMIEVNGKSDSERKRSRSENYVMMLEDP
jgi:hypothetical protein